MSRCPLCSVVLAVVLFGCVRPVEALQHPALAAWTFDRDLRDQTGRGNDVNAEKPHFVDGHRGQGLDTASGPISVTDSADIRLAPGLRLECWVRFTSLKPDTTAILVKDGEYMLRVDPADEGGHISWFVYLDGWEPRVRAGEPPKVGVWYHLVAGWSDDELMLSVNGDETRAPRSGLLAPTAAPLQIGPLAAVMDDLQIENPAARQMATAYWPFDGDLHDAADKGHDLNAEEVSFAPGRVGQALRSAQVSLQAPDSPDLHLAPGLAIDCSVYFDRVPSDICTIAIKDGEYQLRVNPAGEGGCFAFFVNLDGWEPRVSSSRRVEAGVWYHLTARWDGRQMTLRVNGETTRIARSGSPQHRDTPLAIGPLDGQIDELRIENPQLPVLRVRDVRQEHTIFQAGRPERFTAVIHNVGTEALSAVARLDLPSNITCIGSPVHDLGTVAMDGTARVDWTVQSAVAVSAVAGIRLTAANSPPVTTQRILAFVPTGGTPALVLPPEGTPALAGDPVPVTYYVDSLEGRNTYSGTSPETPWQDFSNINGKTLGAGEALLIKRGSVINQELSVGASGTAARWAEIGAYGTGARPVIRRNWDIDDRCVLVQNPDFLRISSLVVCYAGKGLVVHYRNGGHRGLVIEDCIAHHIEGLYRPNSHGIPEWRDRNGAGGDGLGSSAGIAIAGANATDLLVRNCEMFQTSWGFFVKGDAVTIDRVYCHDNYAYNTSPHPALIAVRRAFLQNSIFDAPGWHAYAGTMGIMLCDPQGLTIRNCTFRNQPDSGSHDEGSIDFENLGNGCLIDHCTFENNAGAAIEVLGLQSPQPRNLEIMNSRFIRNNRARKLGPAEIYIWGQQANAEVCCSTGSIHDNGYVTNPGVEFFVNQAPETTAWELRDNTRYTSVEALDKAMPFNRPPIVEAGPDLCSAQATVRLMGSVRDDNRPGPDPVAVTWEVLEGPGSVVFQDPSDPETTGTFSRPGDYLLRLVGDDGELWLSDTVAVHVLPPPITVAVAWEFNTALDKEGWTEVNPGTQVQSWENQPWPCVAYPVKYVAGGYYILAIENSTDAHLLSPDNLGLDLTSKETVRMRFQNHTPATRMRLYFTTASDATWDSRKSLDFDVVPTDDSPRQYAVDMSTRPGWTGRLRQLRLDLATGQALTGTCRFDYIRIDR